MILKCMLIFLIVRTAHPANQEAEKEEARQRGLRIFRDAFSRQGRPNLPTAPPTEEPPARNTPKDIQLSEGTWITVRNYDEYCLIMNAVKEKLVVIYFDAEYCQDSFSAVKDEAALNKNEVYLRVDIDKCSYIAKNLHNVVNVPSFAIIKYDYKLISVIGSSRELLMQYVKKYRNATKQSPPANMIIVESPNEVENQLKNADDKLVTIVFDVEVIRRHIIMNIGELAILYPDVVFLLADKVKCDSTATSYGVASTASPSFVFKMKENRFGGFSGYDVGKLYKYVDEYLCEYQKGRLISVSGDVHLQQLLKTRQDKLVIIDFDQQYCRKVNLNYMQQMASNNKDELFIQADKEMCEKTAEAYHATIAPKFVILKHSNVIYTMTGTLTVQSKRGIEDIIRKYKDESFTNMIRLINSTDSDFEKILDKYQDKLICIAFDDDYCEQLTISTIPDIAIKNPEVMFVSIEKAKCATIAAKYDVQVVPTYLFQRKNILIEKLVSIQSDKLNAGILNYKNWSMDNVTRITVQNDLDAKLKRIGDKLAIVTFDSTTTRVQTSIDISAHAKQYQHVEFILVSSELCPDVKTIYSINQTPHCAVVRNNEKLANDITIQSIPDNIEQYASNT